eukprot:UN3844
MPTRMTHATLQGHFRRTTVRDNLDVLAPFIDRRLRGDTRFISSGLTCTPRGLAVRQTIVLHARILEHRQRHQRWRRRAGVQLDRLLDNLLFVSRGRYLHDRPNGHLDGTAERCSGVVEADK